MLVAVHLFAESRRLVGSSPIHLDLPPGSTVSDLKRLLANAYPSLSPLLPSCRIALDSEYAPDSSPIPPSAELALIPPVSGG